MGGATPPRVNSRGHLRVWTQREAAHSEASCQVGIQVLSTQKKLVCACNRVGCVRLQPRLASSKSMTRRGRGGLRSGARRSGVAKARRDQMELFCGSYPWGLQLQSSTAAMLEVVMLNHACAATHQMAGIRAFSPQLPQILVDTRRSRLCAGLQFADALQTSALVCP